MPGKPTLSVIYPNYNHGKYLEKCMQTCLSQSLQPDEIIVIDDGSTDDSVKIMEGLVQRHPQISFYRNETNRGVMYTVNRAAELAQGDYIGLFAIDDELQPGFFEKSLALLAQYPQAAYSGTITEYTDMATGATWYLGATVSDRPCYLSPEEMAKLGRKDRMHIATCSTITRRKCFLEAGKYLTDIRWHSDWFQAFVCGYRHGVCFIPEPLSKFYIHPQAYSIKGRKQIRVQLEVLRNLLQHLEEPQYADVAHYAKDALALAHFGKEMMWLLLTRRRYWKYLTPAYFPMATWWTLRMEARQMLPSSLAKFFLRLAGYQKLPQE